jgi:hypothetical protein
VPDRFEQYPVPGGGIFKVGGGRERKRFDNERLVSRLADAVREAHGVAAVVTDDGEVLDPAATAATVAALVERVARATGALAPSFTGWRSTVAKELGIALGDYADTEDAPLKPRIEGRSGS